jgi:hypothetical protein
MDMRKYGSSFYTLEDVLDGPCQETIAKVTEGKFGKPNLLFESGRQFGLNATNRHVLVAAYGHNSDDWIDMRVELFAGIVINQKGEEQDGVRVRPVSPGLPEAERTPLPAESNEMEEDVPF